MIDEIDIKSAEPISELTNAPNVEFKQTISLLIKDALLLRRKSYPVSGLTDYEDYYSPNSQEIKFDSDQTTQNLIRGTLQPLYFSANLKVLRRLVDQELIKKVPLFNKTSNPIETEIDKLNNLIAQLRFKDIAIEYTQLGTIKYTMLFPNQKILIISKKLQGDDRHKNYVIFSYFEKRELIASNFANLEELIEDFSRILNN